MDAMSEFDDILGEGYFNFYIADAQNHYASVVSQVRITAAPVATAAPAAVTPATAASAAAAPAAIVHFASVVR